jgi:hypothetical protein
VVAAVYVRDQSPEKVRKRRLVPGLEPAASAASKSDADSFAALCFDGLHIQPNIVSVRRLGPPTVGRIQPSLVIVKQADQAQQIIKSTKLLRRSSNAVIRDRVFINPQMMIGGRSYLSNLYDCIGEWHSSVEASFMGRINLTTVANPLSISGTLMFRLRRIHWRESSIYRLRCPLYTD